MVIAMKKSFEKIFPLLVDSIWVILFVMITSISLFITNKIGLALAFLNNYIKYSILALLFINIYVIITGILCRLFVRKITPGHSKIGPNRMWMNWRLNWHFYSMVFLFFKKFVFYNRTIRYIFLRLLRVNIKYSTYFAETVDLQDANNLLTIGANSGLGSEVLIATHLALSTDVIIYKEVIIGENSHLQAKANIAPGVVIGNNCVIGFGTSLSLNVKMRDNVKIGGYCVINTNVKIGANCKIGDNVRISPNVVIADNIVLPDNAVIKDINDIKILNIVKS